jgi:hypothetical protein
MSEPVDSGTVVLAVADGSAADGFHDEVAPAPARRSIGRFIAMALAVTVLTMSAIGGVFLLAAAASPASAGGGCGGVSVPRH